MAEDRRHLHRKEGPITSIKAAYAVDANTWLKRVHALMLSNKTRGITAYEARDYFPGEPYSTVTSRFPELHAKGLAIKTPWERETGSHNTANVWVSRQYWEQWRSENPRDAAIWDATPALWYTAPQAKQPIDGVYICPCCENLLELSNGRLVYAGQKELF
jgi:hypothetical protein